MMRTPTDTRSPDAIVASMEPARLLRMAGASGADIAHWYGDAADAVGLKRAARERITREGAVSWDTLVAEANL